MLWWGYREHALRGTKNEGCENHCMIWWHPFRSIFYLNRMAYATKNYCFSVFLNFSAIRDSDLQWTIASSTAGRVEDWPRQ